MRKAQSSFAGWRSIAAALTTYGLAGFGAEPASGRQQACALVLTRLHCEYLENPLGIDDVGPRLGWVLESPRRAEHQGAYRILVASTRTLLDAECGDLWDSGQVPSDSSIQVEYAGVPLASRQVCRWRVRAWDGQGRPSAWSEPAFRSMGLLADSDWSAKWMGRARGDGAPGDGESTVWHPRSTGVHFAS